MKPLLKTLAILACLCLIVQMVRHAYLLWLEPRSSVLDRYDKPLKDEISSAKSLDELVRLYDPIRKKADTIRAQQLAGDASVIFGEYDEPFRSERQLKEAIESWERRAKEVRELRFYWLVGLVLGALGLMSYFRTNRWVGLTLLIAAFSEFIYWTSPTFLGPTTREFDRLLLNKLIFSALSLMLAAVVIRLLHIFREEAPVSG